MKMIDVVLTGLTVKFRVIMRLSFNVGTCQDSKLKDSEINH